MVLARGRAGAGSPFNPNPESLNPKPESLNPKPETRNLEPENRTPKPETLNAAQEALERSSVVLSVPTLQILLVPQVFQRKCFKTRESVVYLRESVLKPRSDCVMSAAGDRWAAVDGLHGVGHLLPRSPWLLQRRHCGVSPYPEYSRANSYPWSILTNLESITRC